MADALVIKRPQQAVRRPARRAGRQLHRARKRNARADRPERRRQDHGFQSHHGLSPARHRLGDRRSATRSSACKPHDICAHGLARTFQVAKPFGGMTVLDNVMTGAFLRDRHVAAARAQGARGDRLRRPVGASEQTAARDLTTIDQRRLEMARALATRAAAPAARRGDGGAQSGRDRSGGRADRQALEPRAHHRHRRACDARHHGGREAYRGARPRAEDRRRQPEGDRGKSGSDPRLSRLGYVHRRRREPRHARARRRQRQLRLGARDRRRHDRGRRRRGGRPARRQRRRQEHDACAPSRAW